MRARQLGLVAIVVVVCFSTACATAGRHRKGNPNDETPFRPLVDATYGWAKWPDSAYYEGNLRIPVTFWSRTRQLGERDSASFATAGGFPLGHLRSCIGRASGQEGIDIDSKWHYGCTASLTPHFVVRQTYHESAPVRTPTFNPILEWNLFSLRMDSVTNVRMKALDDTGRGLSADEARELRERVGKTLPGASLPMLTLHLRFAHYSNGQSGCSYAGQTRQLVDGDSLCLPEAQQGDALNYTDGSFSMNYFELAGAGSWFRFDGEGSQRRGTTASLGYRFHINEGTLLGFGGLSQEFQEEYGRGMVMTSLDHRMFLPYDDFRTQTMLGSYRWLLWPMKWIVKQRLAFRFRAEGEGAVGRERSNGPWRSEYILAASLPALGGMGLAVRHLRGWDYYNIGFPERIDRQWSIGLTIDHSIGMTITKHARERAIYGR